jgi:opacity protein-like surface antigen
MRRSAFPVLLAAACAFFAAPALAQTQQDPWFIRAGVGPAFGTFGSTPVVNGTVGYGLNSRVSLVGELGMLRQAPFDKAAGVAPSIPAIGAASDIHVNAYHANANVVVQQPWKQLFPYVTVGLGTFTGSTVASGQIGASQLRQYDRATRSSVNVGFGTTYRLSRWLGLNADYRRFVVHTPNVEHVDRFVTGVSLFIK